MSTDVQKGLIHFICDGCEEAFEGKRGESFADVYERARDEEGWVARKKPQDRKSFNVWQHFCKDCQ